MEVHEHREPPAAFGRGLLRRPVQADSEAARRPVVHDVRPLNGRDVGECRSRWSEDGFVCADDGPVAEELDDAGLVLHDVRCGGDAGHGVKDDAGGLTICRARRWIYRQNFCVRTFAFI